ncbi:MAG: ABC transporter permease [Planctomycetota bacterium]|jgi:ABC-2 type transport system permease protein
MKPAIWKLDLYRILHRPAWIGLIVLLFLCFKGVVFLSMRFGAFGRIDNGFAFLALSATYTVFLGSFLLCLLAGGSMAGEYSRGILRMHLARSVSRIAYFMQRLLSLTAVAAFLILLDAASGSLVGWLGFGFGDTADVKLQGPQFSAGAMVWASIRAYSLTFLGLAGIAAIGLLVSVLIRSAGAALGASAALFFILEGMRILFREPVANYMATRYTQVHLDYLSGLARGIAGYQAPDFLLQAVGMPLAIFILASLAGLWRFRSMDILE